MRLDRAAYIAAELADPTIFRAKLEEIRAEDAAVAKVADGEKAKGG